MLDIYFRYIPVSNDTYVSLGNDGEYTERLKVAIAYPLAWLLWASISLIVGIISSPWFKTGKLGVDGSAPS